ncbi:MAG: hypothetical protein JW793_02085 [Acidobacteria bacterium]|nr:hypothetical protein [Acidobacteriota bacterium]
MSHFSRMVLSLAALVSLLATFACAAAGAIEYRVLATRKTSIMQKELQEAGAAGFEFVGVTVADTAMGGAEVVSILRRAK